MMRTFFRWKLAKSLLKFNGFMALIILLAAGTPLAANAALISYSVTPLAGSTFRYDFSVTAEISDPVIEEFSIFFNVDHFLSLSVLATPMGWDTLVLQPDSALPADGVFDGIALSGGIHPGETVDGFSAIVELNGQGFPERQYFEIVDPNTFQAISTGSTLPTHSSEVPEPSTVLLVGLGIAAASMRRREPLRKS